jgi:preprotein translocase subunit Sec63
MSTQTDILGVRDQASEDEVRHAHRRLVRMYHPDHGAGDPIKFQLVQQAYEVCMAWRAIERNQRIIAANTTSRFGHPDWEAELQAVQELISEGRIQRRRAAGLKAAATRKARKGEI